MENWNGEEAGERPRLESDSMGELCQLITLAQFCKQLIRKWHRILCGHPLGPFSSLGGFHEKFLPALISDSDAPRPNR